MASKIDRELFHAWLWETRGRKDFVGMSGAEIARQFSLSRFTPTRLFAELMAAGKLKKARNGKYIVIDPELTTPFKD